MSADCSNCGRPFKRGQRGFRYAVITAVGMKWGTVCRRCRGLLEHDEATAVAFADAAGAELALMATDVGGHA